MLNNYLENEKVPLVMKNTVVVISSEEKNTKFANDLNPCVCCALPKGFLPSYFSIKLEFCHKGLFIAVLNQLSSSSLFQFGFLKWLSCILKGK